MTEKTATPDAPARDAKAGFCSNCRAGSHGLCMKATCTCPDARRHRNRPGYGDVERPEAQETPPRNNTRTTRPTTTPVIELVREEPPAPVVKLSVAEQIMKAVEDGLPVGGEWFRVVIMPTPRAAKALATKLSKHDLTARMALEWQAGGSKLFVKGPA